MSEIATLNFGFDDIMDYMTIEHKTGVGNFKLNKSVFIKSLDYHLDQLYHLDRLDAHVGFRFHDGWLFLGSSIYTWPSTVEPKNKLTKRFISSLNLDSGYVQLDGAYSSEDVAKSLDEITNKIPFGVNKFLSFGNPNGFRFELKNSSFGTHLYYFSKKYQ